MVSLGSVSLDGSKFAANASKRKAMSYGRMVEQEERLEREIAEMLARAAREDAAEDAAEAAEKERRGGGGGSGSLYSEEIERREGRLAKLRAAKAALEAQVREAAEAKRGEWEAKQQARAAAGERQLGGRGPADPEAVTPAEKAQRNFTDPESRIMKGGDGSWVQGYNGQALVDRDHQVITACDLTNMAADAPHLESLVAQSVEHTGAKPDRVAADAGYFSAANVEHVESQGIEALIPPDRQRHGGSRTPAAPLSEAVLATLGIADRMRHQLSTAAGRAGYADRKKTVEPTFGQIKGCPGSPGFRQFLRRGLKKCKQEWEWVCATHNFLKYMRVARGWQGRVVPG